MITKNVRRSLICAALCCFAMVIGSAGCVLEEADQGDDAISQADLDEAGNLSPKAWTGWVSEETPPIQCSGGTLVQGVDCSAGYCDNIRLDCISVWKAFGTSFWTTFFSEEGDIGVDSRVCPYQHWLTGIDCNGNWCDNLSLHCTKVAGAASSCNWTSSWYSEETGPFVAPPGYYVRGVRCDGSYCDNLKYYYCKLL